MTKPQPQQQLTPEALLTRAQATVHLQGQKLRLPDCQLSDVLQIADRMLEELRTNELPPKQYYELNLQVVDNLGFLQSWFLNHSTAQQSQQVSLVELYQRVQYSQHAVPRMYLMLTVGACFLQTPQAQTTSAGRDVMRDMLEMCKSVQNPARGLFLRHYLCQVVSKDDHIALLGPPTEQADYLLLNFAEMAKLWMRLVKKSDGDSGGGGGALQLGQLVGQNLTRLSEFPLELYQTVILPRFASICTMYDVEYVQAYLLDVLISSFPLEYQLSTLDAFLQLVAEQCAPGVRQTALCSLLDRFQHESHHASSSVFQAFCHLFASQRLGGGALLIKMLEQLGGEDEHEDEDDKRHRLLDLACQLDFAKADDVVRVIELAFAARTAAALVRVLQSASVARLFGQLTPPSQQLVSTSIVLPSVASCSSLQLDSRQLVEAVFAYFTPQSLQDSGLQITGLVFRLANNEGADAMQLVDILDFVKTKLEADMFGDEDFKLQLHQPVWFRYMDAARRVPANQVRQVVQTVYSSLVQFAEQHVSKTSTRLGVIKLLLQLALQADQLAVQHSAGGEDAVAYECMVAAFSLFEEEPDSKCRVHLVPLLVGTVQSLESFSKENLDILQTKVALYSAQLLKKQDQAKCLAMSSALFWNGKNSRNGKRALECLQRAGKTCPKDMAIQVDLLNLYVTLYNGNADKVKASHIAELIQHIRTLTAGSSNGGGGVDALASSHYTELYFQRTLLHLRSLGESQPARFGEFATLQATRQTEDF